MNESPAVNSLSAGDLVGLVHSVFPPFPGDRLLAVLVDLPHDPASDNAPWRERRGLAAAWAAALRDGATELQLEGVDLIAYPDVGSNNADLPAEAFLIESDLPDGAAGLAAAGRAIAFEEVFASHQLYLAPTEFSTTAPLKNAAKRFGFRAATMPGFAASMVPALRIDYGLVAERVMVLKDRLDAAAQAEIILVADGLPHFLTLDLRHRTAHSSTGRFPEAGTAGNLPSGEAYIVPFEGGLGDPSQSAGTLPVDTGRGLVVFTIAANRAVEVRGEEPAWTEEADHLRREPAYGNMAELGFGVLADFGLDPVGEILLDEKLGLHIAFGRSDHFGGAVGPKDFSTPAEVIHLDRIYIPQSQPRVAVRSVVLVGPDGGREEIIRDGTYRIF
ncbi:MAG: hypothetical protein NTZ26_08415 [Candidatus Aminicenantes bacterium]|nr:hypothetical protein [Candidatus Aminicenantes bacterium]